MDKKKEPDAPLTLEERFHSGKKRRVVTDEPEFEMNRRIIFVICLAVGVILSMSLPLIGIPALIAAGVFLLATYKDPNCPIGDPENKIYPDDGAYVLVEMASLLRELKPGSADSKSIRQSDDYDKFIDVLIRGGVIDNSTQDDEIVLEVIATDPPTFELELYQIGKTERQLVAACENALLAYNAYLCDVHEIGDTNYRITYLLESEIDTLSGMGDSHGIISYDKVVNMYLTGGNYND